MNDSAGCPAIVDFRSLAAAGGIFTGGCWPGLDGGDEADRAKGGPTASAVAPPAAAEPTSPASTIACGIALHAFPGRDACGGNRISIVAEVWCHIGRQDAILPLPTARANATSSATPP
jgi:uncharacterized protein (DUF1778 family)